MPWTGLPVRDAIRLRKNCASKDIAGAGAKRGHRNRDHVDAIEQILAEPLLVHFGLEVTIGRGDHACFERNLFVSADGAHLALLQHTQQLDLHLDRHLADLVEEDRPGSRLNEQTGARSLRVGERAPNVTEQLALEERRRHRGAVDRDERLVAAWRQIVKRACDELFARAALARDEHGGVAVGHATDHLDPPPNGGA